MSAAGKFQFPMRRKKGFDEDNERKRRQTAYMSITEMHHHKKNQPKQRFTKIIYKRGDKAKKQTVTGSNASIRSIVTRASTLQSTYSGELFIDDSFLDIKTPSVSSLRDEGPSVTSVSDARESAWSIRARRQTVHQIVTKARVPLDDADISLHPSYTNFKYSYDLICMQRYKSNTKDFEKQAQHELQQLVNHASSGYEGAKLMRMCAYTSLWPPLHTAKELQRSQNYFRVPRKNRARLQYLMENEIS